MQQVLFVLQRKKKNQVCNWVLAAVGSHDIIMLRFIVIHTFKYDGMSIKRACTSGIRKRLKYSVRV